MNIYTISFLIILLFNFIKNKRSIQYLQINHYNQKNQYIKWIKTNSKQIFSSIDLLSLIVIFIAFILNNKLSKLLVFISIIFYILESIRLLNNYKLEKKSKRFVETKRIRRLIVTVSFIYLLPIIIYIIDNENYLMLLLVESLMTYFSYIIILAAKVINNPIEKTIYKFNKIKAIEKINSMENLKTIGITGAYGKTSNKSILNSILSNNYSINQTPRELNTENSFILTINNSLRKNDEIFIAEMKTYNDSEIKKICDMIKPKIGVITNIGIDNLNNYKSSEDITKSVFKLIESLPNDGLAILNRDDKKQLSYKIKNKCKKIWIGIDNKDADIRAVDIVCNYKGSKFNVEFKGDKEKYPFETKLLGKYNIYNILVSIAVGKELGIPIPDLKKYIKQTRQIEGKLELKDFGYMFQLDNMNNNNPIGAKNALDVLNMMPGTKVVVTDGILSNDKETEINNIYGNQIAKIDPKLVILVGEKQTKPIFKGLLESNYSKDNIYVVKTMNDAYNLIQTLNEKDKRYVLFE